MCEAALEHQMLPATSTSWSSIGTRMLRVAASVSGGLLTGVGLVGWSALCSIAVLVVKEQANGDKPCVVCGTLLHREGGRCRLRINCASGFSPASCEQATREP